MYTLEDIWEDFQKVYDVWFKDLQGYSEMDLWRAHPDGGWCIGQIYQHILNGTLNFQVIVIKELIETQEDTEKEMSELGVISYRENAFPPRRFQTHRDSANEPDMSNKMKLRNQMKRAFKAVQEVKEILANDPPSGKFQHQIFGYLDAKQWYQNIPMHWRHHLRQKEALDEAFTVTA
ncbi:MAG TPA: hypothetical protein DCE41_20400 [Cytophagales bacterium]|nr:hypothetical protein [Cytophagales bacterium]HAA23330.1 hypothetical protein [Cytophagales bacterium]HAP65002.1 hypothetical protein [Cytophagales bacterium]